MMRGSNHHHQSYNKYTNQDVNSYSEDMVERIVCNTNMLVEMIDLMIHNQENNQLFNMIG